MNTEVHSDPMPAAAEGETTDVVDLSDLETGPDDSLTPEVSFHCKLRNQFYVEFLQATKKVHVGLDNIGDWVKQIYWNQQDVSQAPVRKKKKRPSQEEMPWHAVVSFYDDPSNNAINFVDALQELDEPIRIRVRSVNNLGQTVETFVLKNAVLDKVEKPRFFDITDNQERLITLYFTFDEERRKSS